MRLWTCNNIAAQKWEHHSDGTLYNEPTKFCLDDPNINNGTQLYVHECNGGTNQRWQLPQALRQSAGIPLTGVTTPRHPAGVFHFRR